eukprot:Protomagalhaensia_wolfi_Nauph_80__5405@NODE_589_length_2243_cov_32_818058_g442_i0_p2_GENE_NODE_589_length_2243_cov_32_818058_g442_i0NODE_589_length_2243_cov_32_818058_g442_i0_p2_ORF_typecomplete_len134_score17_35Pam16/PF03656_13/4_7e10_NODE_589_length_2243_cov_32_818058_g442_i015881989
MLISFLRVGKALPSIFVVATAKWAYASTERAMTGLLAELRSSELHLQSTRRRVAENTGQPPVLPRLMSPDYARALLGLPPAPHSLAREEIYAKYVALMKANQKDPAVGFSGSPYLQKKIHQAHRILSRSFAQS